MDGDVFCAGAEQMPATTLRAGGIVICDNLSVHKNAMPCAAIEAPGEQAGRAALPACLFAGPRPHRDGIRQTHRPREKRRRPVRGYPLQSHGIRTRRLHLAGLRATPPPSRSCVNLIGVHARGQTLSARLPRQPKRQSPAAALSATTARAQTGTLIHPGAVLSSLVPAGS